MIQFLADNGLSPAAFLLFGMLLFLWGVRTWASRGRIGGAFLIVLALVAAAAPSVVGIPVALTNAALLKLPASTLVPMPVARMGVNAIGDAPVSWWWRQSGTCASHSMVSDVGSCNDGSDGNSFIAVFPTSGIDIRQFGADSSNSADSTTAINAALAVGATNGLPIRVRGGTYKVNSALAVTLSGAQKLAIQGDGHDLSRLSFPSGAGLAVIATGNAGSDVNGTSPNTLEVSGLGFLTGTTNTGTALNFTNLGGWGGGAGFTSTFRDLWVGGLDRLTGGTSNYWAAGLTTTAVSNVYYSDMTFVGGNGTGVGITFQGGTASFTGSITSGATPVLTASSVTGTIQIGTYILGSGVAASQQVTSQLSGTPNGAGTYQLGVTQGSPISSESMTGGTYAVISNCVNCTFWSTSIGYLYGTWAQGVALVNNNFTNGTFGVWMASTALNNDGLSVINSQFNVGDNQINLLAAMANINITNNLFFIPSNKSAIFLADSAISNFVGNNFQGLGGSTNASGILASDSSGQDAATVTGNTYYNLTTGNSLQAGTHNWVVSGNSYNTVTNHNFNAAGVANTIGACSSITGGSLPTAIQAAQPINTTDYYGRAGYSAAPSLSNAISVPLAGTVDTLMVGEDSSPGSGNDTFTIYLGGVSTALTCQTTSSTMQCTDLTHQATIGAGVGDGGYLLSQINNTGSARSASFSARYCAGE